MYKWLKEYFTAFGKDFPFSEVKDLNEYEIIRIIQDCVKNNRIYTAEIKRAILVFDVLDQHTIDFVRLFNKTY